MKYLKRFETEAQCTTYMDSEEYIEPFVGLVDENEHVEYNAKTEEGIRFTWDGSFRGDGKPNLQFLKQYHVTTTDGSIIEYSGCPIYVNGVQIPETEIEEGEEYRNIFYSEEFITFYFKWTEEQEVYRSEYWVAVEYDYEKEEYTDILGFTDFK